MLISKYKNIMIIGYPESSMTQEFYHHVGNSTTGCVEIVTPEQFVDFDSKELEKFSYMVSFTLDKKLRLEVINRLDDLDSAIYLHDTVVLPCQHSDVAAIKKIIGPGSFFGPYTIVMLESTVGKHCIMEARIDIGHYSRIGDNVIMHGGTSLGGRTLVGNNCEFLMKSSILPKVKICDDVVVGALTNVTKSITSPGVYLGSVARRVNDKDKITCV